MKNRKAKRILAILLTLVLVVGATGTAAFAVDDSGTANAADASGLKDCHTAHDESCGYTEAAAAASCTHTCEQCAKKDGEADVPCDVKAGCTLLKGHTGECEIPSCTLAEGCTLPTGHTGECEIPPCTLAEGCTLPMGHTGECTPPKNGDFTVGRRSYSGGAITLPTVSKGGLQAAVEAELRSMGQSAPYNYSVVTSLEVQSGELSDYIDFPFIRNNLSGIITLDISGISNTVIPTSAFNNVKDFGGNGTMNNLQTIKLPASVTTIEAYAFKECIALKNVDLSKVTDIGADAFVDCKSLQTVDLGSATRVRQSAFLRCEALTTVGDIPNLTNIEESAFFGCKALKEIDLSNVKDAIGTDAFSDCKVLTTVGELSTWLVSANAFKNCIALTDVGLKNVTRIDDNAFFGCISLEEVDLRNTETIMQNAFNGCENLATAGDTSKVYWIGSKAFYNCKALGEVDLSGITVMKNGDGAFNGCASLTLKENTGFHKDLDKIPKEAFKGCASLKEVDLSKVGTIEEYAFAGCKALTTVGDLSGRATINNGVFSGCTLLKEVNLGSVESVGENAFSGCKNLTIAGGTANLTTVGKGGFSGCESLKEVDLRKVTSLEEGAFFGCKELTLKEGTGFSTELTEIPAEAFMGCKSLKAVDLSNVTSIGKDAFNSCPLLGEVNLSNVKSIKNGAFYGCETLTLKSGTGFDKELTEIPADAFTDCKSLKTVDLSNVISIGAWAFSGCETLGAVDLSSVEAIGQAAFSGCKKLTLKEGTGLNASLTNISEDAFTDCALLNNVDLSKVESIKRNAFSGCASLNNVDLSNIESIEPSAFSNCKALTLKKGTGFHQKLTNIPIAAFSGCTSLGEVNLSNVTSIGAWAFRNCTSLKKVDLSNVTSIGERAFLGCETLGTVDLSNVKSIGEAAFYNCISLGAVDLSKVESIEPYAFFNCVMLTLKEGTGFHQDITEIPAAAFAGCASLKKVDLSNVESIEQEAFGGCESLGTVGDTSKLTTVKQGAFVACESLGAVDLSNVTSLGDGAFSDCKKLTLKEGTGFHQDLKGIPEDAFKGCASLNKVDLSNIKSIGAWAFSDCASLGEVDLSNVESIGIWAFYNCISLGEVDLSNVESIGGNAFNGCKALTLKSGTGFHQDLKEIPVAVFAGCASLKKVDLSNVESIEENAFRGCKALTLKEGTGLSPNPTRISDYAFSGCASLSNVDLGGVISIASGAFSGCTSLKALALPADKPTIYNNAFVDVPALMLLVKGGSPYADLSGFPSGSAAPSIAGATIGVGRTLSLDVLPNAGAAVSYQWSKDGAEITGATGRTYSKASAAPTDSGSYTCSITLGKVSGSASANVTVAEISVTPVTADAEVTKAAAVQSSVSFSLSNTPPYGDDAEWKVYTAATGTGIANGITISYHGTGNVLTLSHASNIPAGKYYVAVTERDKAESERLALTVMPPVYALSFSTNGGSGSDVSGSYAENTTVNIDAGTKSGYMFDGWTTSNGGTFGNAASAKTTFTMPDKDTTITATWKKNAPNTYTLTFDANGGSGSMVDQVFADGAEQALAKNAFTKTDFNFAGWNTEANGSGTPYADGQRASFAKNTTLYAQWSKGPDHSPIDPPDPNKPIDTKTHFTQGISGNYANLADIRLNGVTLTQIPTSATTCDLRGWPGYDGIVGKAESGSVIVTFYKEFLQTLTDGNYILEVEFLDETTANTGKMQFAVQNETAPAPTSTPAPGASPTPSVSTAPNPTPKTGDDASIALWILLAVACVSVVFVSILYKRHNRAANRK